MRFAHSSEQNENLEFVFQCGGSGTCIFFDSIYLVGGNGLWIGLVKVKKNYSTIALVIVLFSAVSWVMQKFIVPCLLPPGATVQQSYTGQGAAAILPILLFGMIQTGLSEEILFRGFILKRLSKKLGFQWANFLQALIFGVIHGIGNCFISLLSAFAVL